MARSRRRWGTVAAIAALVVTAVACQAPGSILRGRLTDAATGTHPAGVPVVVYADGSETVVAQTVTDRDGDYSFLPRDLADGSYRIRFSTATWWDGSTDWASATTVAVADGAPVTIDATVADALGPVRGAVTDPGGAPLAGVAVAAIDAGTGGVRATATTAPDGTYGFAALPAGSYVVRFTAGGWTTRYHGGAPTRAAATSVPVPGAPASVDVVLAPAASLSGVVTDGAAPVAGVIAAAYDAGTGELVGGVTTGADGTFVVDGLDARPYAVGLVDPSGTRPNLLIGSTDTDPTTADPTTGLPFTPPPAADLPIGAWALGDDLATFVVAGGSSSAACGPLAEPCATVALAQAHGLARGVHAVKVGGGTFVGTVRPATAVTLSGGWTAGFGGVDPGVVTTFAGDGSEAPLVLDGVHGVTVHGVTVDGGTRVAGSAVGVHVTGGSTRITLGDAGAPGPVPTAIGGGTGPDATGVLVDGGSSLELRGVTVDSGTPTGAGSSAYGVRALAGAAVTIDGATISAQAGVAGADAPSTTPAKATAGCNGSWGDGAYGPSSPGVGGSGGGCTTYAGGKGGTGGNYSSSGTNGAMGSGPDAGFGGSGGCGSLFGCGGDGGGGGGAGAGVSGTAGVAGSAAPASAAAATWTPTSGGAGGAGAPGSGGGGGGGGKSASASGGGGGGGGAGGNGGTGGAVGGGSGGGSFAVYALDASVTVHDAALTAAAGGAGGAGAKGGAGGAGGDGGYGGSPSSGIAGPGGAGGGGGAGGAGAGAGGGAAGPSIAVLHVGAGSVSVVGGSATHAGVEATGGAGGAGGAAAAGGVGGPGTRFQVGGNGAGAAAGPSGASGSAGLVLTSWDNGTQVP